jgi:multidrug efflux pump subunit AcrA (membrane-fusion protein)
VDQLPLVEGMFCFVEIPGRTLDGVFRLPRWAVSFKNTVYASVNGRLATVPVEVARTEGEEAFVSEGLKSGDVVITNRLIDPLENSRLEVTFIDAEGGDS